MSYATASSKELPPSPEALFMMPPEVLHHQDDLSALTSRQALPVSHSHATDVTPAEAAFHTPLPPTVPSTSLLPETGAYPYEVPDGFKKDVSLEAQHVQDIAEKVQAWLLPCKHGHWDWLVQQLRCYTTPDPVLAINPQASHGWWKQTKSAVLQQWLETWLHICQLQPGYIKNTRSFRFKCFVWGLAQMGLVDPERKKIIHERKGLWVLPYGVLNRSVLAYQLTHWLAEQQGLPGYTLEAKTLYHQWGHRLESPAFMKALHHFTMTQTLALQAAIRREMEALRVTYELC